MKKQNVTSKNPYATNSLDKITAPHGVTSSPRATLTKGDDLRATKKKA